MVRIISSITLLTLVCLSSACIVGGWSSNGGGFIWPGSFVFIVLGVLLLLMMFRRR